MKTADLRLSFEGDVYLQVFNNSSGYEGWQAYFKYDQRNLTAIGMGGGALNFCE